MDDTDPVTLREITRDNVWPVICLRVAREQARLVMPVAPSLAISHYQRETSCRAIYSGETPVGFVMLMDRLDHEEVWLWRLLVDHQHQRQGHGAEAVRQVIAEARARPEVSALMTSHEPAPGDAGPFYEALGFSYTGEADPDGERIMRLDVAA